MSADLIFAGFGGIDEGQKETPTVRIAAGRGNDTAGCPIAHQQVKCARCGKDVVIQTRKHRL